MAQQTRLETMLPYYMRWMERFPTIRSLANSSEQDVLAIWEGLGYYSRARNLRRAAQIVIEHHDGRLPSIVKILMALPGIGRYTAGAVTSIAFGLDEPAVDGNTIRVLARVFNIKYPVGSSQAINRFWELAAEHLPSGRAADYNQALMDLGASVCKPCQPDCLDCPLRNDCGAYALGIQEKRPIRKIGRKAPLRYFAAAVIKRRGRVLVLQRPAKGLLASMWEFPNVVIKNPRNSKSKLNREIPSLIGINLQFTKQQAQYEHAYSHFTANLQVFTTELNGARPKISRTSPYRWAMISKLGKLPMGKLDRQIAQSLRDNAK